MGTRRCIFWVFVQMGIAALMCHQRHTYAGSVLLTDKAIKLAVMVSGNAGDRKGACSVRLLTVRQNKIKVLGQTHLF